MPDNEQQKSSEEKIRAQIDASFEDYRKSGIALMATVIALSSGGIAGLFQIADTRDLALLYFIPIALAVLQQLAHYFASKAKAQSAYEYFRDAEPEDDAAHMEAHIGGRIYFMHSNMHFRTSDVLSWLACMALGLVSFCPLLILAKPLISFIVIGSVVAVAVYWIWSWKKMQQEIDKIVW